MNCLGQGCLVPDHGELLITDIDAEVDIGPPLDVDIQVYICGRAYKNSGSTCVQMQIWTHVWDMYVVANRNTYLDRKAHIEAINTDESPTIVPIRYRDN